MFQINPIDISNWRRHREFSEAYPEGARPKRIVLSPKNPVQEVLKPDWQYMFKLSDPKYPEQYWAEIIAYQIALLLEIPVPPAHAAYDSMTGEYGAISEWFYIPGDDVFYAAGHFFHREIRNFDKVKGTQHNLLTAQNLNIEFIGERQIFDFWSMLLFDSLIGNTDRHQENWGYLLDLLPLSKSVAKRKKENYSVRLKFAPWFDNGTSLGHQILPQKFLKWDQVRLDNFIKKGTHHFRYAPDNLVQVGHLDSMRFIGNHNLPVKSLLLKRLKNINKESLNRILSNCVGLAMPLNAKLTPDRAEFIQRLTLRRAEMIRGKLNERY